LPVAAIGTSTRAEIPSVNDDFPFGRRTSSATYRVQLGETLEDVARRVYGDPSRQTDLLHANSDQLSQTQDIRAGMILRLP
jgi:nucleoid-associated protein YgaU